jgi:PKD repeat protein
VAAVQESTIRRLGLAFALLALVLAASATPAYALRQSDAHGQVHGVLPRPGAVIRPFAARSTAAADDLQWNGGAVMHSNSTHAIYWDPAGTVPSGYRSAIDGFLQNVATASGALTNVYAVDSQYYDSNGNVAYSSSFAGALTDSDPYPANGCTATERATCLTDQQLQDELAAYIAQNHLPTGLGDIYFVLTPASVMTCIDSSTCSSNYYCAYHGSFVNGSGHTILYADDPYPDGGCPLDQYPNGPGTASDEAISTLSHEHNETITDPNLDAWYDSSGEEIGDKCEESYGPILGGSSGAGYDQAVATGHYYVQEEWSNTISGCAARVDPGAAPTATLSASPTSTTPGRAVTFDATGSSGAVGYTISFGDGSSGSGPVETHSYGAPGVYTAKLTATGAGGATATATATVTVNPPPDRPPACSETSGTVPEGGSVAVALPCADPDPGDSVTRMLVSGPAHGTLGPVDQASGTVAYTPAPGFSGADTFVFRAIDSHGASSATEVASVVVTPSVHASVSNPVISGVHLTLAAFKLGRHGPPHGAHVSYTLAVPTLTTFFVERRVAGVVRGGRCVRRSGSAHGRSCTLFGRLAGKVTREDGAGRSDIALAAILKHFHLRPGQYRLVASFLAGDGTSAQSPARFRVKG